jgi:hypothetical protein
MRASAMAERRALLQRVLWSPQVAKSSRIRQFLEYVCERALQDSSAEIHEQEIGCQVFGRSPDYDTGADNVVRVTASQARKKLEQYFSTQGATEPCILEIPKGGYTPVFRERDLVTEAREPAPETLGRRTSLRPFVLLGIAVPWFLVVAGGLYFISSARRTAPSELDANPSLKALWSQLLPTGGRTDVVVTDSGLSLSLELERRILNAQDYLHGNFGSPDNSVSKNPELRSVVERMAQRRLTSIGSVTMAFRVAELAGNTHAHVSIISPRDFNIHQMKTDNAVLMGSRVANPWVHLLEDHMNFHFDFDPVLRFPYFENRDPQPGELKAYHTDSDVSYCQIVFLPNLAHTGNVLAISGAEVEGTEGGGEFVTSERSLSQLRSLMKLSGNRFPYFEVLLKSSKIGGSTPGFTPVAFRILRP